MFSVLAFPRNQAFNHTVQMLMPHPSRPSGRLFAYVCPAWAFDRRWKSSMGLLATTMSQRQLHHREVLWGRSWRRTVAPNASEPLSRQDRPGKRAYIRDAQQPAVGRSGSGGGRDGTSNVLTRGDLWRRHGVGVGKEATTTRLQLPEKSDLFIRAMKLLKGGGAKGEMV